MDKLSECAVLAVLLTFRHFHMTLLSVGGGLRPNTTTTCEEDHRLVTGDMLMWNMNALTKSWITPSVLSGTKLSGIGVVA